MAADSLAFYDENLDTVSELREEISNTIRNEMVDDYASKELRQIRSDILKCEEQMKQKAEQVMHSYKECMADIYCTFRNGRVCIPVKKEYKLSLCSLFQTRKFKTKSLKSFAFSKAP